MHSEKDGQGKPSFQLRSMAQTRSTAKSLRNVLAFVMVQAGLCATPAEEMEHLEQREITTPCYECGNNVSKKRAARTHDKYKKELCLDCEKKLEAKQTAQLMDPKFIEQSVAQVQERKAAQPIVAAMDAGEPEYA
jgi:ssDNA-binding Zn-finger/Zn-ribbon topoisomerase 1